MDINFIIGMLKTIFIERLDYNIAYISILFLLFFYASSAVKRFLKSLETGSVQRFIIFSIFLIFGTNPLLVFLTNLVLSVSDAQLRWAIIFGLLLWSFAKFDEDIGKIAKTK